MHRDKTLDRLRGFAMMWVILVHVLFWGGLFNSGHAIILKSFFLFEMPLFFFITGASNSIKQINDNRLFILKRFEKCLIPYWVFALICATLSAIKSSVVSKFNLIYSLKIYISWLFPVDHQVSSIPYLTWALWFIPVYLCIILVFPLISSIRKSKYSFSFLFILIMLYVLICNLNIEFIQNVSFYLIWTYIGTYYFEIKPMRSRKNNLFCILLIGILFILLLVLQGFGFSMNMQSNKFPPNIIFFFFSLFMMLLIYMIHPILDSILIKIENSNTFGNIYKLFCVNSMTIFLYQVFAFNISLYLINLINISNNTIVQFILTIFCFVITILFCFVFGKLFAPIEKISLINYKHN